MEGFSSFNMSIVSPPCVNSVDYSHKLLNTAIGIRPCYLSKDLANKQPLAFFALNYCFTLNVTLCRPYFKPINLIFLSLIKYKLIGPLNMVIIFINLIKLFCRINIPCRSFFNHKIDLFMFFKNNVNPVLSKKVFSSALKTLQTNSEAQNYHKTVTFYCLWALNAFLYLYNIANPVSLSLRRISSQPCQFLAKIILTMIFFHTKFRCVKFCKDNSTCFFLLTMGLYLPLLSVRKQIHCACAAKRKHKQTETLVDFLFRYSHLRTLSNPFTYNFSNIMLNMYVTVTLGCKLSSVSSENWRFFESYSYLYNYKKCNCIMSILIFRALIPTSLISLRLFPAFLYQANANCYCMRRCTVTTRCLDYTTAWTKACLRATFPCGRSPSISLRSVKQIYFNLSQPLYFNNYPEFYLAAKSFARKYAFFIFCPK